MMNEIEIFTQRLAVDPLDQNAFLSLRNLYMRAGQYAELAQLYEMRSAYLGSTPEAADLLLRAAELWLDQMADITRGTGDLLRTLDISPNHRVAAERLEKIYRDAGDYQSLLEVLMKFVEGLELYEPGKESARTRSNVYQEIGEIWETFYQRTDAAIVFYKKAAQADPTNVMSLYLARNIYLQAMDYDTAARLYDLEINAEPDPERKKALLRELAILKERNLDDIEGAIVALRRAMVLSPSDTEVLYELGTALIRKNGLEELINDEYDLAADCFFRLAQLSDDDVAIRYLETALDLAPTHQGALEMYEHGCVVQGRWHDLKIRLQRSLDAVTERRQRIPILRKLGRLTFEQLQSPLEAVAYLEALEEYGDPSDLDVLARVRVAISQMQRMGAPRQAEEEETLDQLLQTGRTPRPDPRYAAPALRQEAAARPEQVVPSRAPAPPVEREITAIPIEVVAPAPEEAPRPAARPAPAPVPAAPAGPAYPEMDRELVARLKSDAEKLVKLGMAEKAEEKLREVVRLMPDDQQSWTFLEKRLRSDGKFAELRDLFVEASDSPYLDKDAKTQKLRDAAALSETRLRDVDSSVKIYQKMLAVDPRNRETRRSLERLLTTNKKWDEYVALLEGDLYETADVAQKIDINKKIAEVHLLRRDDPKSAANSLWRAVELKPDDADVLQKLDELALRMRDWEELEKIVKVEIANEQDREERMRLFGRLVSLQEETLENIDGAYETCRRMREESPDDIEVLRRMARIEDLTDRFKELDATLRRLGERTDDPKEKASALKKLAYITWDQFDNAAEAALLWEKYFEYIPDDLDAYDRYGTILEGMGRSEDLIAMYRRMLQQEKLRPHHRFFLRKLGTLLSSEAVGRREEAMEVWRRLLEGGDDPDALRTLAIWDRENERWEDLTANLRRQLRLAKQPQERVVILKDVAEVLYEHMGKPNEAIMAVKEALKLNENDPEALAMLRSIYATIQDYTHAAEVLEKEIALMQDASIQFHMLTQLSEWYKDNMKDKPKAISAFERILALESGDRKALDALETLYEEAGEWEKLLRLLRTKTKGAAGDADRLGYMLKGAKVCEEILGDRERGWGWYREIFGKVAVDEDVMGAIEKAAERMGQWADLAGMYEELASRVQDRETKVHRLRQAAAVLSERIADHARALDDVNQACLADADKVELLDEADRYALACGDWARLALVYDRISRGITDEDGKVMLLRRFARVVWREGRFPQGAVMPLLRAAEEKPADEAIFGEFNEAALEAKEYEVLLDALDKRFRATGDKEERIALKLRMSRIMAEYLGDIDGAIKIIREAVEVDPASEKFGALILGAAKSIEAKIPPQERGYVFQWLLKTYQQHAESYDQNDPYRVVFLKQIGKIFRDGLADPANAFATFCEAHRLEPGRAELLAELDGIAAASGYWDLVAEHLAEVLRLSIKMEVALVIHEKRAGVLGERLGKPEDAAEHFWQILQLDPAHPSAFAKLTGFYREGKRFNDLLMLLESKLEKAREGDAAVRRSLMGEIAAIWEKDIGNKFEAIDAYRKIVAEFPDDREAQDAIGRLQRTGLGLALRLGGEAGEEEEEKEEEKVDIEELKRSLLQEDARSTRPLRQQEAAPDAAAAAPAHGAPPAKKAKGDRLPDWEDEINTNEVASRKVAEILNKIDSLDEETGDGAAARAAREPSSRPPAQAGAPRRAPEAAAGAGDAPSAMEDTGEFLADDLVAADDEEGDGKAAPPAAKGGAIVLDEASLKDMLQEEIEIHKPPAQPQPPAPAKEPAPPAAGGKGDERSFPPPPPKAVRRRTAISAPPPPPPKKK